MTKTHSANKSHFLIPNPIPVNTGIPGKLLQTTVVKTDSVDPLPDDDHRSPISNPYDNTWNVTRPVGGVLFFTRLSFSVVTVITFWTRFPNLLRLGYLLSTDPEPCWHVLFCVRGRKRVLKWPDPITFYLKLTQFSDYETSTKQYSLPNRTIIPKFRSNPFFFFLLRGWTSH